jgi:hypothetical protein
MKDIYLQYLRDPMPVTIGELLYALKQKRCAVIPPTPKKEPITISRRGLMSREEIWLGMYIVFRRLLGGYVSG